LVVDIAGDASRRARFPATGLRSRPGQPVLPGSCSANRGFQGRTKGRFPHYKRWR